MSFDVSALSTYTDQTGEIIRKAVAGARTLKYIRIEPGIQSAKDIHTLSSTLYAQASNCGFNASGSTVLGKVGLSVCPLVVQESLCIETLEQYFTQLMLRKGDGSYKQDMGDIEPIFIDEKAAQISAVVENLIWQGNTVAGTGNNSLCRGLLYYVDNTVSASTVNVTNSAFTAANAISIIDTLVNNIPAAVRGENDLAVLVSEPSFYLYLQNVREKNYFNPAYFSAPGGDQWTYQHPASNVKVIGVAGLNASANRAILTPLSNIVFGTDMMSDFEQFKLWFSMDTQKVLFHARWKQGVALVYPEFAVRF